MESNEYPAQVEKWTFTLKYKSTYNKMQKNDSCNHEIQWETKWNTAFTLYVVLRMFHLG
jgi:hypothetical protein